MQWIRRCKQEELNLVDSYAGHKAQRLQQSLVNTNQQKLYPTPERMHLDHAKLETLSKIEE